MATRRRRQESSVLIKDDVIIYSHPRSGLHLLSLGLYIMGEHFNEKSTYDEIWGSGKLPSYRHWFHHLEPEKADLQFKKHILLLRDYKVLATTYAAETTSGLSPDRYSKQILKFERLKSPKMVIYFEDLISDNNTFIEVADFLDIKYDLEKLDFKYVRNHAYKLYLDSGHKPSIKAWVPPAKRLSTHNNIKLSLGENQQEHDLFDKYLRRYNNG